MSRRRAAKVLIIYPDGWMRDEQMAICNRYSPVLARLRLAALLRELEKTPWTHTFDQSFQDDDRQPRTVAQTIHYYSGMLVSLPTPYRPKQAWVVAAPHPTSGRMHCHGFWHVEGKYLGRGWWRAAKEYVGDAYGWMRVHAFAARSRTELAGRLEYPAGHAVKESPTGFWQRMAWFPITTARPGWRSTQYHWGKSWWSTDWVDGKLAVGERER